jgi:hypothetical protein
VVGQVPLQVPSPTARYKEPRTDARVYIVWMPVVKNLAHGQVFDLRRAGRLVRQEPPQVRGAHWDRRLRFPLGRTDQPPQHHD